MGFFTAVFKIEEIPKTRSHEIRFLTAEKNRFLLLCVHNCIKNRFQEVSGRSTCFFKKLSPFVKIKKSNFEKKKLKKYNLSIFRQILPLIYPSTFHKIAIKTQIKSLRKGKKTETKKQSPKYPAEEENTLE